MLCPSRIHCPSAFRQIFRQSPRPLRAPILLLAFLILAALLPNPALTQGVPPQKDPVLGPIMKAESEGRLVDAKKLVQVAIRNAEPQSPPDRRLRALLSQLAGIEIQLRHPAEAVATARRMVAFDEKAFGPESSNVVEDLSNLGEYYVMAEDDASAGKTFEHALAVMHRAHLNVPLLFDHLSEFYKRVDRTEDAEALLTEAVEYCDAHPSPHFPGCSGFRNQLANLNRAQGHATYADEIVARGAQQSVESKYDWYTQVSALNAQARQYEEDEDYARAEAAYRQAIDVIEKAPELKGRPGDASLEIVMLGRLFEKQARLEDAEKVYESAVEAQEASITPEWPEGAQGILATVSPLVRLYRSEGRAADAEPVLQQALDLQERILGTQHTKLSLTLQELAAVYEDEEKFEAAEPLYQRIIALKERAAGPDDPQLLGTLDHYSALLRMLNQPARAKEITARANALRQKLDQQSPHPPGQN
jgi:tetratricopeptide (TPR) repeat protein